MDKWYLLQEVYLQGPPFPLSTDTPCRGLCQYAHTSLQSEKQDIISCQVLQTQKTQNMEGITHRAYLPPVSMKTERSMTACSPHVAFKDRRRRED